jgi:hypothetical protein
MGLLPVTATFEEQVQDCFLSHRGAGVMLCPLDVELVMAWAQAQVPFEVVARGIRRAAEKALWDARPGEPALRTLRACRREVDAEIRKYAVRATGRPQEPASQGPGAVPLEQERHKRLRSALLRLARENPELAAPVEQLRSGVLAKVPEDLGRADFVEELCCALLLRALPFRRRLELYKQARLQAAPATSSAHARRVSCRFHRHAMLRRALGVPSFW